MLGAREGASGPDRLNPKERSDEASDRDQQ